MANEAYRFSLNLPAYRWGLTPALTGAALAARLGEDSGWNDDGGSVDHKEGRVRGRMQRSGMTALD
jgi:hypothetical protein